MACIGRAAPRLQSLRAAALGAALLSGCGPATPPPPPPRPDVLLVVCDTLRADRTAALHREPSLTPALAALAARGVLFRQAVSPASWTLPAMAALFSGADATANRHSARAELPALAERFRAAGYATLALSANPLLTADNGFARGFDTFVVAPAESVTSLRANLGELRAWNADALVARALREAAGVPQERPLFVWLQLMDAHVPYDPAHETAAPAEPGWSEPRAASPRWDAWDSEPPPPAEALLAGWRRAYDGQVLALDGALSRLLEHWGEVRAGEPLVAVTADHGEGLFDHARNPDSPEGKGPLAAAYDEHGEQLYEEALRVPLVLAGPGLPRGRVEARAVSTRDLGATLLRLCGAGEGPGLPLAAADAAPDTLFGAGTRGWYARRGERLLVQPYPERASAPGVEPLLLPVAAERREPQPRNLAADEPEALRALQAALADWLERSRSEPEAPLDDATRARLSALGYVR